MTIVRADLTEQQRERLTSHLTLRGIALRDYTCDLIRTALLELLCAPRSSLENPSFRPTNQQRTFYAQDYGDLDGSTGYWAAEEETGQKGLVQELRLLGPRRSLRRLGRPTIQGRAETDQRFKTRKEERFVQAEREYACVPVFEIRQKGKGKTTGKPKGPKGKSKEPFPVDWTKGKGKS